MTQNFSPSYLKWFEWCMFFHLSKLVNGEGLEPPTSYT